MHTSSTLICSEPAGQPRRRGADLPSCVRARGTGSQRVIGCTSRSLTGAPSPPPLSSPYLPPIGHLRSDALLLPHSAQGSSAVRTRAAATRARARGAPERRAARSYIDDVFQLVREAFARHPHLASLPRFMFGHSMGGLIAVRVMERAGGEGVEFSGLSPARPDPRTPRRRAPSRRPELRRSLVGQGYCCQALRSKSTPSRTTL
jgi:pimeloyl-ACP methyl ester carboxylesterase